MCAGIHAGSSGVAQARVVNPAPASSPAYTAMHASAYPMRRAGGGRVELCRLSADASAPHTAAQQQPNPLCAPHVRVIRALQAQANICGALGRLLCALKLIQQLEIARWEGGGGHSSGGVRWGACAAGERRSAVGRRKGVSVSGTKGGEATHGSSPSLAWRAAPLLLETLEREHGPGRERKNLFL